MIAEATAMRNGIKAAVQAGFTYIHIEGDSKTLSQAIQGHIQFAMKNTSTRTGHARLHLLM